MVVHSLRQINYVNTELMGLCYQTKPTYVFGYQHSIYSTHEQATILVIVKH